MSDSRYFKNPFPEYIPSHDLIDEDSGELSRAVKENITRKIHQYMAYFEKQLKTKSDARDFSVYTGSSGHALLYILAAGSLHESEDIYLENAMMYAQNALSAMGRGRHSNPHTFLCGDSAPFAISAYLHYKKGDMIKCDEFLKKLMTIDVTNESADELLYGRAGYLYTLMFAVKYIPKQTIIKKEHQRKVIVQILESGKRTADKYGMKYPPLFYIWYDEACIGAAHGFAGILFLLLECRDLLTEDELNNLVKPSIENMFNYRLNSGNYRVSVESKSDNLVHWCHGAPGIVYLFALAYKVFNDEKYLIAAIECGEVVWKRGLLTKGYGICHGVAGNGYTFIRLFQLTRDEKHLYRALKFAEWCFDYGTRITQTPDTPLSMFEGLAGTIYFIIDILSPLKSCFPAFQLSN